jgi:hypothetical protein
MAAAFGVRVFGDAVGVKIDLKAQIKEVPNGF